MHITVSEQDGVRVIALAGRLDAPAAPEAQEAFAAALVDKPARILVDLGGVEYVSSGGIRAIIMLMRGCEEAGTALKLCGLSPFVKQVFEISNLIRIFDIYPSVPEGVAAFQAVRGA